MSGQSKPTIPGWAWFYDSANPYQPLKRGFICRETLRSWVHVEDEHWADAEWAQSKAPKKTTVFVSEEEVQRLIAERNWVFRHRSNIARLVSGTYDHDTLRKIAELVGYQEGGK